MADDVKERKQRRRQTKSLRIVWRVTEEQRRVIGELVEWSDCSISWWLTEAYSQVILKEWAELWQARYQEGKQEEDE